MHALPFSLTKSKGWVGIDVLLCAKGEILYLVAHVHVLVQLPEELRAALVTGLYDLMQTVRNQPPESHLPAMQKWASLFDTVTVRTMLLHWPTSLKGLAI
jgi:predicted transcriptional regulator